jgi:hypothetical protein
MKFSVLRGGMQRERSFVSSYSHRVSQRDLFIIVKKPQKILIRELNSTLARHVIAEMKSHHVIPTVHARASEHELRGRKPPKTPVPSTRLDWSHTFSSMASDSSVLHDSELTAGY